MFCWITILVEACLFAFCYYFMIQVLRVEGESHIGMMGQNRSSHIYTAQNGMWDELSFGAKHILLLRSCPHGTKAYRESPCLAGGTSRHLKLSTFHLFRSIPLVQKPVKESIHIFVFYIVIFLKRKTILVSFLGWFLKSEVLSDANVHFQPFKD